MGRTALFGGTFDPVHNAHLQIAKAALEGFGVARVLFVPASNPPHKTAGAAAPYDDRVRMLELACAGNPAFEVSRIEEGPERSYSILTIERLLSAGSGPLSFLIGADAFAEIQTWYRWREVITAVEFIVVTRPGATFEVPPDAIAHELGDIELPVSSSQIREQLAQGDYNVPVPVAVLEYIRERGLYRSQNG